MFRYPLWSHECQDSIQHGMCMVHGAVLAHVTSNVHVCVCLSGVQAQPHCRLDPRTQSCSSHTYILANPSTLNLMEILAEALFQLSRDKDCPKKISFTNLIINVHNVSCNLLRSWNLATSGFVSFLGELSTPLQNCGLYGNGMMVACQLYLNHSYHQTGLKIK